MFSSWHLLVKDSNRNTLYEICSKSTIKIPERHQSVFIVNCEWISKTALVFTWLALNKEMPTGIRFCFIYKKTRAHMAIFLYLIKDQF